MNAMQASEDEHARVWPLCMHTEFVPADGVCVLLFVCVFRLCTPISELSSA